MSLLPGAMYNGGFVHAKSPYQLKKWLWPEVTFYREQKYVIDSVVANDETFVVAGNMLGKDYVAGFLALWAFLCHPVARVITTSVKDDHLRVLWGEIGNFIGTARYPLTTDKGGPLIVKHRDITKLRKPFREGIACPISYLRGMVSEKGEGMAGHHAPYTLIIIDEASGVDDVVYNQADTWAKRKLIIGNPNYCANFFFKGIEDGDLLESE